MPQQWKEEEDVFETEAQDGRIFRIHVYVTKTRIPSLSEPEPILEVGAKEARTEEGYSCNRIDNDTWEILYPLRTITTKRVEI